MRSSKILLHLSLSSFMETSITKVHFGSLENGQQVEAYTLTNANGMQLEILSYGGIISKLLVPNRAGKLENIVLGFSSLEAYQHQSPYFGAIVGRFANRIAKGKFNLEGKEYTLAVNNGTNHLHGGIVGLDKVIWQIEMNTSSKGPSLLLSYFSPDGEEGYPGNVHFKVNYTLTHENNLEIDFEASCDRPTIINLTQHSYFNLAGNLNQQIHDYRLQVDADYFLPVNEEMIPTGELKSVQDTPFDFRKGKSIGEEIDKDDLQLKLGAGFDHCYALNNYSEEMRKVAVVHHPFSGRIMEVLTTLPGMQLYTANHLVAPFLPQTALCLETQYYPDSPNHPHFPSSVFDSQTSYRARTHFSFSID